MGKSVKLTEEQEKQIIYNYTVLHYGQKKAGAFIPVKDKAVKKVLIKYNIPIKTIQETNVNKYNINHNFFKEQTNDMGYWIGILGSDGCVASQENQVYIELQEEDKELLEKLNKSIKNERPVKEYITSCGYKNCKLYFHSKEIKKDLQEYRIIPNKTYDKNYGFPYKLNKQYYLDYIRGMFDGDGSIKLTGKCPTFQIDTSSEEIADEIIKIFKEEYNIELKKAINPKVNINLYRVYGYGKEKCRKIYDLLYSTGSNLFLARKKKKFQDLIK